jgi:uncharacterized membrane protein YdjX (TVP38/TMEM64 family)
MTKAVLRYGPFALLAVLLIIAWLAGLPHFLRVESLRQRHAELAQLVLRHRLVAGAVFLGLYFLVTAANIPGATFLTFAGGNLFGVWLGGGLSLLGGELGALAAYFAVRSAFGEALRTRAERRGPRLARLMEGMRKNAFTYILGLRLIPLAPFWLVNMAGGLADAPFNAYAAATLVGLGPGVFLYSAIGAAFMTGHPLHLQTLLQPKVLAPLAAPAALIIAAAVYQTLRWRRQRSARRAGPAATDAADGERGQPRAPPPGRVQHRDRRVHRP